MSEKLICQHCEETFNADCIGALQLKYIADAEFVYFCSQACCKYYIDYLFEENTGNQDFDVPVERPDIG